MIAIVDYGMGNLRSVQKACAFLGYEAILTPNSADLDAADRIILPGVGAFPQAIEQLKALGLDKKLQSLAFCKPMLGICLGMHLFFGASTEGGYHTGLS